MPHAVVSCAQEVSCGHVLHGVKSLPKIHPRMRLKRLHSPCMALACVGYEIDLTRGELGVEEACYAVLRQQHKFRSRMIRRHMGNLG